MLALGTVGTGIAYMLFFAILRGAGASRSILVTYLVPGAALAYGAVFLGEPLRATALIGLALILGGRRARQPAADGFRGLSGRFAAGRVWCRRAAEFPALSAVDPDRLRAAVRPAGDPQEALEHGAERPRRARSTRCGALSLIDKEEQAFKAAHGKYTSHLADLVPGHPLLADRPRRRARRSARHVDRRSELPGARHERHLQPGPRAAPAPRSPPRAASC